jgi:hypothetical protein
LFHPLFVERIRTYLNKIDGKIILHNKYIRTKLRVNDRSIMERVTELELTKNQDKNAAYDDLELEAQLNVDADKYAGDFQLAKGKCRPI